MLKQIKKLYNYIENKNELTKAQLIAYINKLIESELETFKFLQFTFNHQLINNIEEKYLIKLVNSIKSVEYAKWLLKYNFQKEYLLKIVLTNPSACAELLFNKTILTEEEKNQLFIKAINDSLSIILCLKSDLTDSQELYIKYNYETVKGTLNAAKLIYTYKSQLLDQSNYTNDINKLENYIDYLYNK